jgi:ferredoxin--NADP+ reductase
MVSLNPIMVDGTGMCGGCRVSVAGKTRFACVDGPEFDGHEVDFDLLTKRLRTYVDMEKASLQAHVCKATTNG